MTHNYQIYESFVVFFVFILTITRFDCTELRFLLLSRIENPRTYCLAFVLLLSAMLGGLRCPRVVWLASIGIRLAKTNLAWGKFLGWRRLVLAQVRMGVVGDGLMTAYALPEMATVASRVEVALPVNVPETGAVRSARAEEARKMWLLTTTEFSVGSKPRQPAPGK